MKSLAVGAELITVRPAYDIPESCCPTCGHPFKVAIADKNHGRPKAGDLILCMRCDEVLEFDSEMQPQVVDRTALTPEMNYEIDMGIEVNKQIRDMKGEL